jgi:hypothetical protein
MGVIFHAPGSVGECEGMNPHTPKWAPTLGVGVPMDSRIFKKWLQGSKLIGLGIFLYYWKALGPWMSKMGLRHPFGHLKHKLWPKEWLGVNLTIWLPTTKSQTSPRFPCVQVACDIPLERSWPGLQFCFRPHLNWRSTRKIMGPQVVGILVVKISRLPLGSPGTKWHLSVGPMVRHRVYYKGEGGGFPEVRAMVNFMSPCLHVVRLCTKVLQLCINQLVVWFVQACVNK